MGDLRELIEKLEKLEGLSREVDLEIARAVLPDVICMRYNQETRTNEQFVRWQYTTSLDAAIALCERVLPDARWEISTTGMRPGATVISYERRARAGAYAATPAVALVLATLRAKAQEGEG